MSPSTLDDPFDSLLTLEDDLYTTAYAQGTADGSRAGRIEGRIFGLEKGFEKFAALAHLHGRASVWGARLPRVPSTTAKTPDSIPATENEQPKETESVGEQEQLVLPGLPPSQRLQKHVHLLHALTDPLTFSTLNTEDAVADFDDRFKRAGAKAKVIERIVGETSATSQPDTESPEAAAAKVRLAEQKNKGSKKGDDSMEDFGGSRFLS